MTTTFKMPEFVTFDKDMDGYMEPCDGGEWVRVEAVYETMRDVLEQIATKFEGMQSNGDMWVSTVAASVLIRAMIEEVQ